jgi:hypothetical protein
LYLSVAAYDWTDDNPREPILMPGWTRSNFFEGLFELFMLQLTFNDISIRENRIDPAFDKTFQWIFRSPQSSNKPWSSFVDWLISPQHVYWITGKAGSGKSTLMKYIVHHQRTQDLLRICADKAGKKQLVSASFYFVECWITNPKNSGRHVTLSPLQSPKDVPESCVRKFTAALECHLYVSAHTRSLDIHRAGASFSPLASGYGLQLLPLHRRSG